MPATTIRVGYRPIRIGFCVDPTDIEAVISTIELASITWGGMYCPIIPVVKDSKISDQLIALFDVDVLYSAKDTSEIKHFVNKYTYLKGWHLSSNFFQSDDNKIKPTVIDISNIIDYYWEKDFRITKKSNCIFPQWNNNDPLSYVFSANFGKFPTDKSLVFDYKNGYKQGLRAKLEKIKNDGIIKADFYKKITPILLTNELLQLSSKGWLSTHHGVYIGKHDNPYDLINFWNLRACGNNLIFIPIKDYHRIIPFAEAHIDALTQSGVSKKFEGTIAIWCEDGESEKDVVSICNLLLKQNVSAIYKKTNRQTWNSRNTQPPHAHLETKTMMVNVEEKYGRPRIALQLPDKIFKKNQYNNWQKLVLTCIPSLGHEYPEYTLALPNIKALNHWYGRQIIFHPHDFRVGKQEFGKIINLYEETANIDPLSNKDLIYKILDNAEIKASSSQPGLLTQRIIEQMGDLDDCRVFQITGVRKLIETLTANTYISRGKATRSIWDEDPTTKIATFNQHRTLYIQPRDKKSLTTEEVFDYLIDKNVFRVGLEPICTNCGLRFWLSLGETSDRIKCEYCGFELKLGLQLKDKGDWKFRRSGLFGKDNKQEGSIPVILSLMHVMRRLDASNKFIYTTATKINSQKHNLDCETDLIVINVKDTITEVLIGECKSNNYEITDEDIDNLVKLKDKLDSESVITYILFSKTAPFTIDEISRFNLLKQKGVSPILLNINDLEPYEPYFEYSKKGVKLPLEYANDFEGMAINSDVLYLMSVPSSV